MFLSQKASGTEAQSEVTEGFRYRRDLDLNSKMMEVQILDLLN